MRANKLFSSIEELVPHRGRMVLITDVVDWGDGWLVATVDHSLPSLFAREDGTVPACVGVEYMAQSIAALIGVQALQKGLPVRVGFLTGTQMYETSAPFFAKNSVATIKVEEVFSDKISLALYDCSIRSGEDTATAQIKVVRPDNPDLILKELQEQ